MAIALYSSRCFDAVSNALQEVKRGNASKAASILHSVKSDARLMQKGLQQYHQTLKGTEKRYEDEAGRLTRVINDLYQREQKMRGAERELKGLKQRLHSQNESNVESLNEARRRYRQTEDEERKFREKRELHEVLFFIPIVNIFAAIAEAVEENGEKACQARADMKRYQRRINEKNDDIRRTNSRIRNIQEKINEIQRKVRALEQERDSFHQELGAVKSTTVIILDAIFVSREILNLTESATVKTEDLEKVMRHAAQKNTLRILKSGGTKTKVVSFKEGWEEIDKLVQESSHLRLDEEFYLD